MIRHTAVEAIYVETFARTEAEANEDAARKQALGDGHDRTSIAALVKIICNTSTSKNLRRTACECLGERIAAAPEFAAFAVGELFARKEAGVSGETIFEALLAVIRETPFANGTIFDDAVTALSSPQKKVRFAAAERFLKALEYGTPASLIGMLDTRAFTHEAVVRRA